MRRIGTIEDPEQAKQFAAYLVTLGTNCSVDDSSNGQTIWVQEEDRVPAAKEELNRFLSEPNHERYQKAIRQAVTIVRERQQRLEATRERTIDLRDQWQQPTMGNGPATVGLMGLMVAVAIVTRLDPLKHPEIYHRMEFILDKIFAGEFWRLISPIFLHMTILHLLFNLFVLRDFGLMVEHRLGTLKYLAMVLLIAVISNYAQFRVGGSGFGGMSGVNYGLFGYILVRSRLTADSGLYVSQSNVVIMFAWFIMCLGGVIPNIANAAHTAGLILGMLMGASKSFGKLLR